MRIVGVIAAAVSAAIISLYLLLESNLPFSLPLELSQLVPLIFLVFVGPAIAFRSIANIQVPIATGLMTLALFEAAFAVAPGLFPDNLRMLVEPEKVKREAIVEKLPHPPYAKPKPNVVVHIPGYYGPSDTFVYAWQSDKRGFKNAPSVAALSKVHAVAIGDSFTEGMGVAINDTWASRLSQRGLPTYNLGIQGYAPTQARGAYEHYGRELSPKWVIVGLLANVFERERRFLGTDEENAKTWADPSGAQAIDRLVQQDEVAAKHEIVYIESKEGYRVPQDVRQRYRFALSAMSGLFMQQKRFKENFNIKYGVGQPELDGRFMTDKDLKKVGSAPRMMSRYVGEVIAPRAVLTPDVLEKFPSWHATLRTLERIDTLAKQDGAKMLLVFFPNRGTVYFEKSTGQTLPATAPDVVQARMIKDFCDAHGILMLDTTPVLKRITDGLTDDSPIEAYPYLKVDGHPSPTGHEAIATAIEQIIKPR